MAVLTISRELGSGGREIARTLSTSLGYRYLDREQILTHMREAGHKWEKWAEEFDEHSPRLWEKYDWSYRGFTALVQSMILNEAAADEVVIVGRGGNYLLEDTPFVLRIRIVAPLDVRVQTIAQREGADADSARRLVEKTERERAGFLYSTYGRDGKDPLDYDLVVDSAITSPSEIITAIKSRVPQKNLLKSEDSLRSLHMKALAATIKAHLLTALPFFVPTLDVRFDGAEIHVQGVVHLPRERDLLIKETKNLAGDAPVKFEIRYRQ